MLFQFVLRYRKYAIYRIQRFSCSSVCADERLRNTRVTRVRATFAVQKTIFLYDEAHP